MITIIKNFLAALFNNHYRLTVFICLIAIIFSVSVFDATSYVKLAAKLTNIALFLAVSILFNKFYLSYDKDTDKVIFDNPIALAIYIGLNAVAIGVICTIGE